MVGPLHKSSCRREFSVPRGNAGPNVNAKTDISNWVNAGALNNGSLADGGGTSGSGGSGAAWQICQGDPCGFDRVCCGDNFRRLQPLALFTSVPTARVLGLG